MNRAEYSALSSCSEGCMFVPVKVCVRIPPYAFLSHIPIVSHEGGILSQLRIDSRVQHGFVS